MSCKRVIISAKLISYAAYSIFGVGDKVSIPAAIDKTGGMDSWRLLEGDANGLAIFSSPFFLNGTPLWQLQSRLEQPINLPGGEIEEM